MTQPRTIFLAALVALAVLGTSCLLFTPQNVRADTAEARFTSDGELVAPKDYREWIFLSSGLGMTYGPVSAAGATAENPRFENVFVNPAAYRSFQQNGIWPDDTIFVLEIRSSVGKRSIDKNGRVQMDIVGLEAEVKDSKRFPGKWAFFDLSREVASAKPFAPTSACNVCHSKNGAVDNTFVQFYPTLIPIAQQKGTFHEEAAAAANAPAKSFVFHGKVESLNATEGSFRVNGAKVEGWMEAMTMDYRVDDPAVLKTVKPGDQISATVYDGDIMMLHKVQVVSSRPE